MADPAGAGEPADPGDDVVRGQPGRLVDDDQAVSRPDVTVRVGGVVVLVVLVVSRGRLVRVGLAGVRRAGRGPVHLGVGRRRPWRAGPRCGRPSRGRRRRRTPATACAGRRSACRPRSAARPSRSPAPRPCPACCGVVAEHGVEDRGLLQVAGDPDVGDRDEAEPRVLDPHLERLGDHDLDPVGQLARTRGVHHGYSSSYDVSSSVPLTSCLRAESSSISGRAGDQPLARVEDIDAVRAVGRDHRHPDESATVQVQMTCLRRAHVVLPAQLGDEGPHERALLLQRPDVTEQQVEATAADEHAAPHHRPTSHRWSPAQARAFSRISKVSITSSTLMSLNDPRPMPHS